MENLKPCPFCGKTEHIKVLEHPIDVAGIEIVHIIYCAYCGGQIRSPKRKDAIMAWNRRAIWMSNNETEYPTDISIVWNVNDIDTVIHDKGWNFSPELTEQEKARVLYEAERHHDANVGINWDVLAYWIMDLYADRMAGQISTEEEDEESW